MGAALASVAGEGSSSKKCTGSRRPGNRAGVALDPAFDLVEHVHAQVGVDQPSGSVASQRGA
jgi:hypothetical protein